MNSIEQAVEVTQEDRKAARDFYDSVVSEMSIIESLGLAFARHRINARAHAIEEAAAVADGFPQPIVMLVASAIRSLLDTSSNGGVR